MLSVGTLFGWLLIFSCSDRATDSAETVVEVNETPAEEVELPLQYEPPIQEGTLLTEQLMACDRAASVRAHQYLCVNSDGTWWVDETVADPTLIGSHDTVAGAGTDSLTLLAIDGQPYRFADGTIDALDWSVPVPIESMLVRDDAIWMAGVGRLFRLVDEQIREIGLAEYGTIYDFAASSNRLYLSVPHLVTLDISGDTPTVMSVWDVPVDAMDVDANGDLWVVTDGDLYRKTGDDEPIHVIMPEAIRNVVGPAIWMEGETSTYRVEAGAIEQFPLGSSGFFAVDDYGRLLQLREGQLRRHAVGRPVVVTGLSDSVMVSETVTLLPSDPESLLSLSVWVDDVALDLQVDPYQVTLNPETLAEGGHRLRFFTESEKGDHLSEVPVWVGELPMVEWPEVEALSEQHCARCHGGDTLTDLSTAERWEQHIERIIEVVTDQDMPLDGPPYLSDEEITLIRAWKQGGFQ